MPIVGVYRWSLLAGSETFIRNQALALERYEPLFLGDQRQAGLELPADRVVVATPGRRLERAVRRRLPGYDSAGRLARACRERGVALLHAHFGPDGLSALEIARRIDVPLVVTSHGFDATLTDEALEAVGLGHYVRHRTELFEGATLLIAVSEFIAERLRRQGAPESKLRVHHIGVALGEPPQPVAREPVVLFVGRHIEQKGLGDLVDAMARVQAAVPDARLEVVGDGPLRGQLERRAGAILEDARFVGWQSPDEVRERLQRARILCVPSRRGSDGATEGLGQVILEAAANGVPVVATRHGGIPEALGEDRAGLLAPEADVEGIARRLIELLTDGALWSRLSASARAHVEREFDLARQTRELEYLYDEVLAGAPAGALAGRPV